MPLSNDTRYWIARGKQSFGPYTAAQVREYVQAGNILASDMTRGENDPAWVSVSVALGLGAPPAPTGGSGYGVPYGYASQQPHRGTYPPTAALKEALAAEEAALTQELGIPPLAALVGGTVTLTFQGLDEKGEADEESGEADEESGEADEESLISQQLYAVISACRYCKEGIECELSGATDWREFEIDYLAYDRELGWHVVYPEHDRPCLVHFTPRSTSTPPSTPAQTRPVVAAPAPMPPAEGGHQTGQFVLFQNIPVGAVFTTQSDLSYNKYYFRTEAGAEEVNAGPTGADWTSRSFGTRKAFRPKDLVIFIEQTTLEV